MSKNRKDNTSWDLNKPLSNQEVRQSRQLSWDNEEDRINILPDFFGSSNSETTVDYNSSDKETRNNQLLAGEEFTKNLKASTTFSAFPDDFLIINDVPLYNIPTTAISLKTNTDVFIGETLRTRFPVVSSKGKQDFILNLSLNFTPGKKQTEELHRIVSSISRHPLVYIHNNKIKKSIGYDEFESAIFILEAGNIRNSSESIGEIILDLQFHLFNYKPFSNHFYYNANLVNTVFNTDESNNINSSLPINLSDLTGYESSEYSLSVAADKILHDVRINAYGIENKYADVPINLPSESASWMYYADYLSNIAEPLSKYSSDYIGIGVREFMYFSPQNYKANDSGNNLSFFSEDNTFNKTFSMYNIENDDRTEQQKLIDELKDLAADSAKNSDNLDITRPIKFVNTKTGSTINVSLFYSTNSVNTDSMVQLSKLINTGRHAQAPYLNGNLAFLLIKVANKFPGRIFEIISGSRIPKNPNKKKPSKHNTGHAIDFRLRGVQNKVLFNYIKDLPNCGSGYYPNSVFVHIDYRDKSTFWIDLSGPNEKSVYVKDKWQYFRENFSNIPDKEAEIAEDSEQINEKLLDNSIQDQQNDIVSHKDNNVKDVQKTINRNNTDDTLFPDQSDNINNILRQQWLDNMAKMGWFYYYDDPKVRNLFYRDIRLNISGNGELQKSGIALKNITCSAISLSFGHRIAPIKLSGQPYYTYQFLGAGNRTGQIVLTFSGTEGKKSADKLKELIYIARENSRKFGSVLQEAGVVSLSSVLFDSGDKNNILSLLCNQDNLNINNVVINDIQESSMSDSVDKHQLVIEFVYQDFAPEGLERTIITSIDRKKSIIRSIMSYLDKRDDRYKYRDGRVIFPRSDIAKVNMGSGRSYTVAPGTPSWFANIVVRAADICNETNKKMPPVTWKLDSGTSKTWDNIYTQWGANLILRGMAKNIAKKEQNVNVLVPDPTGDVELGDTRFKLKKTVLAEYFPIRNPFDGHIIDYAASVDEAYKGVFHGNGGPETNSIHDDIYRNWLLQMDDLVKEVKRFISDEDNFSKYFGSIGDEMLNDIAQSKGECYSDMYLPNVPNTLSPVSPDFYVYDDSDEDPALSSLTDKKNMELFLNKHILNEVESLTHFVRNKYLGGTYISENLPRILKNRQFYNDKFKYEYDFMDNFWQMYSEGATSWEPIYYKSADPSIDKNTNVQKWKNRINTGLESNNDDEIRLNFLDNVNKLAPYLKEGRIWEDDYEQEDKQGFVERIYGDSWNKIAFGPNPQYAQVDAAVSGQIQLSNTLAAQRQIQESNAKEQAQRTQQQVNLPDNRIILPDGSVTVGEVSDLENEQSSGLFENLATNIIPVADTIFSYTSLGYLVDSFRNLTESVRRASFGQGVSQLITDLYHQERNKLNSANTPSEIAKMAANIAIGSKTDDLSIRKVYPTFKIYFIEEDSQDTEKIDGEIRRAWDDLYGASAIQEIRVIRSRKIAADMAIIRMTNIGGKLLRTRFGEKDTEKLKEKDNIFADTERENPFEKMILQDGVKTQIRMGYSSDADQLETVFLGQIVEIQPTEDGKLLDIMLQGYGAELEAVELGPLEDGPIFYSSQQALSAAMIQDFIINFGRKSKFNRFNPAEIRTAWTGGKGYSATQNINPINILEKWSDNKMDQKLHSHTFLNYPQDDNIFAPPPDLYATGWDRFWDNACVYRPLKQTPWQIFKEHELRHPGYVSLAVPYGHSPRMTMFFGSKGQNYWSRPPSALEIYITENAYNDIVRMRGSSLKSFQDSKILPKIKKISNDSPRLAAAILQDIVSAGAPNATNTLLAEQFGRYKPFRNYHYFTSENHIIKNNIRTSADGVPNEVEVLYFDDENDVTDDDIEDIVENVQSLSRGEEGILAVKLDENIDDSNLRSHREEFPSCVTTDMARRYVQGLFARHLRDAYKGELVVLGKETLKPYDIIQIADNTVNMSGPVEVEGVTHIFNRDYGFISIVTPDMCVEINDIFTSSVLDVASAATNAVWGWSGVENATPVMTALKGLNTLGLAAGVKLMRFTQEGTPVILTPLTLQGKPLCSVSLSQNTSSLFFNLHGKWVQYWDDLSDAWRKFDVSEALYDTKLDLSTKLLEMLGTGQGGQ